MIDLSRATPIFRNSVISAVLCNEYIEHLCVESTTYYYPFGDDRTTNLSDFRPDPEVGRGGISVLCHFKCRFCALKRNSPHYRAYVDTQLVCCHDVHGILAQISTMYRTFFRSETNVKGTHRLCHLNENHRFPCVILA